MINCKKYITEHYSDPIHCFGYNKIIHYHVGNPYYIDISHTFESLEKLLKDIEFTCNRHTRYIFENEEEKEKFIKQNEMINKEELLFKNIGLNICEMEKPLLKYSLGFDNQKTTELFDVEVSKGWIDKCYEIYKIEQQLMKQKIDIFKTKSNSKLPEEQYEELFNIGVELIKNKKYDDALLYFQDCLKIYQRGDSSYNIACCYALKNDVASKNQALEWLSKAIDYGYNNYGNIIGDSDLYSIKETDEFKQLLIKIKQKDKNIYCNV